MAPKIARAPMKARNRMGASPLLFERLRGATTPRGDAPTIAPPQHRPGQGQGSSPEQRDAFGDRGLFEGAVDRRERQRAAPCELKIGGVVDGQASLAGERHDARVVPRRLQPNWQTRKVAEELS